MTLGMLTLLQAVLGFDNLLYISLESKRVPENRQRVVQRLGIGVAIFFRIALLFLLVSMIGAFQSPVISLHWTGVVEGDFNVHSLIVLAGGVFIIYTAVKEIFHMLNFDAAHAHGGGQKSESAVIASLVVMNVVFSFDSILSAIALTDVFWVMAVAIVIGGVLMIVLAEQVSAFLKRNRAFEVLGLFVLLIVGAMLLGEGGHIAHLHFGGYAVTPMSKTTFYFVIAVLVVVDLVQGRYQRNLLAASASPR